MYIDFSDFKFPAPANDYEQKVCSFLENWYNENSFIEVPTSGSTGAPKIIKIRKDLMIKSAQKTIDYFKLNAASQLLCVLNIGYIAGIMMMVRAIVLKAKITVNEPVNNPFLNVHSIEKYNFVALVPLMLHEILLNGASKDNFERQCASAKIILGGAAVNDHLISQIVTFKMPFFETYGMTETISHVAIKPLNGIEKSNSFEIMLNVAITLDDRNCLKIKSDITDNEWIITNDVVEIINNSFQFLGRIDNFINSGGIKINLTEIEQKIEKKLFQFFNGEQKQYFCAGVNSLKYGQKLVLIIESENLIEKLNPKELLSNCKLEPFKIPKEVIVLPKFDLTASGKIDKKSIVNKLNISL